VFISSFVSAISITLHGKGFSEVSFSRHKCFCDVISFFNCSLPTFPENKRKVSWYLYLLLSRKLERTRKVSRVYLLKHSSKNRSVCRLFDEDKMQNARRISLFMKHSIQSSLFLYLTFIIPMLLFYKLLFSFFFLWFFIYSLSKAVNDKYSMTYMNTYLTFLAIDVITNNLFLQIP
jgi:hypothetical protein